MDGRTLAHALSSKPLVSQDCCDHTVETLTSTGLDRDSDRGTRTCQTVTVFFPLKELTTFTGA